jgi:hypothetical protein
VPLATARPWGPARRPSLTLAVARTRRPSRRPTVVACIPMSALGIAGGLPLTVLLALLRAVLLREVGDTLPNPVRPFGQGVFTTLHLGLDLLAKRAVGGRRRSAAPPALAASTVARTVAAALPLTAAASAVLSPVAKLTLVSSHGLRTRKMPMQAHAGLMTCPPSVVACGVRCVTGPGEGPKILPTAGWLRPPCQRSTGTSMCRRAVAVPLHRSSSPGLRLVYLQVYGHNEPEIEPLSTRAGSRQDLTWTVVPPSNETTQTRYVIDVPTPWTALSTLCTAGHVDIAAHTVLPRLPGHTDPPCREREEAGREQLLAPCLPVPHPSASGNGHGGDDLLLPIGGVSAVVVGTDERGVIGRARGSIPEIVADERKLTSRTAGVR